MINKTELENPTIVTAVVEGIAPKGFHCARRKKLNR